MPSDTAREGEIGMASGHGGDADELRILSETVDGLSRETLKAAELAKLLAALEPWQGQATRRRTRTGTSPNSERNVAL